ncbi:MAG: hypothetical protein HXX17_12520 [Geobacteraceae bacterium]|nr:hypothetical protein [Geobacteraceae bacterium]
MNTHLKLLFCSTVLFIFSGCATLEVTAKKPLAPNGEKQPVTIGVQASGDRLLEVLDTSGDSIIKGADGKLFDRVILLPKETKFQEPQEIKKAHGVDYILSVGISDISVTGDLNPIWFPSLLLFVFKVYTPIVTFQPGVSLDVVLREASTGKLLMQKQVMEASSDHYAPKSSGTEVRKLITLTINNALVSIMQDSQKSIAVARKGR